MRLTNDTPARMECERLQGKPNPAKRAGCNLRWRGGYGFWGLARHHTRGQRRMGPVLQAPEYDADNYPPQ